MNRSGLFVSATSRWMFGVVSSQSVMRRVLDSCMADHKPYEMPSPGALLAKGVKMLGEIAASLASDSINSLVRRLLAVQDQQVTMLMNLKEDLDNVTKGPWRTGRFYLEDAYAASSLLARDSALNGARRAFYDAVGQAHDASRQKALVAADLALVLALLSESEDALRWAIRSFRFAEEHARGCATAAQEAVRGPASFREEWRFDYWVRSMPGSFQWVWPIGDQLGGTVYGPRTRRLRAGVIRALEQGTRVPAELEEARSLLGLSALSRNQHRIVLATVNMEPARLIYRAHEAAEVVGDHANLCVELGYPVAQGILKVDLSRHFTAIVQYITVQASLSA